MADRVAVEVHRSASPRRLSFDDGQSSWARLVVLLRPSVSSFWEGDVAGGKTARQRE